MFTRDFLSDQEIFYTLTMEQMIDKLHDLTSEGRYTDAKVLAQKIKDIELYSEMS